MIQTSLALRMKISAIVNRGDGIPDEMCPEDPESVRFWVTTSLSSTEKDRLKISGQAHVGVSADQQSLGALMGQSNQVVPMVGGNAAIGNGDVQLNPPDNAAILGLVSGSCGRTPKGKSKAAAKPKVKSAVPAMAADKKQVAGFLA